MLANKAKKHTNMKRNKRRREGSRCCRTSNRGERERVIRPLFLSYPCNNSMRKRERQMGMVPNLVGFMLFLRGSGACVGFQG